MISLEIHELPALPNRTKGLHWSKVARERKRWHWLVRAALGHQIPPTPYPRARVELVRCSTRAPDADNLAASWKPLVDGLVVCRVLEDDSPAHVTLESRWEPARRGAGCVRVRVVPLP